MLIFCLCQVIFTIFPFFQSVAGTNYWMDMIVATEDGKNSYAKRLLPLPQITATSNTLFPSAPSTFGIKSTVCPSTKKKKHNL
jgi:hypothetical protein